MKSIHYASAIFVAGLLVCGIALAKPRHHRHRAQAEAAPSPSPVGVYAETGSTFALPLTIDTSINVPGMVRVVDKNGQIVGWFTMAVQAEAITRLNTSWGLWVVDAANPPPAVVGSRAAAPIRIGRDDIPFRRDNREKGPGK